MLAADVFRTYNGYVTFVADGKRRLVSTNKQTVKLAERLIAFLTKKGYQLKTYLAACFAKHNWFYSPRLDRLTLKDYENYYLSDTLSAHDWARRIDERTADPTPLTPRVDPGRELIKARMLADGGHAFCFSQPWFSGGYCAASHYCLACPLAGACGAK